MGIMEVGKIVESWIVDKVKQSGQLIAEQLRVEAPEYEASGKVDLIIDEGGRPILYEIKSTNSFSKSGLIEIGPSFVSSFLRTVK